MSALLVDDEPAAHLGMRALLAEHPDIRIVGEAHDGHDAVRRIGELRPDVVFLDVQMPGLDGFDVVRAVGVDRMPAVVFVTAHDTFAVRAFEVRAVDYLLKPVSADRLAQALTRMRAFAPLKDAAMLEQRLSALLDEVQVARTASAPASASFLVRNGSRDVVVPADDVDWIEADDYCVVLHARRGAHVMRDTLVALEARLPSRSFVRIHRSAMINVKRVAALERNAIGALYVVLVNGTRLPVSRSRKAGLIELLGQAR